MSETTQINLQRIRNQECTKDRMTADNAILSPESTVTSLLASSGHIMSTSESSQAIWFKDRSYESASEALDAYIADFQRSQLTSGLSSGQLKLPKTPVTSRPTRCRHRNKDVLKESLSDRELNFLHLPVGAQSRNTDRLSLSTDDLLVLPCDGSLPITRTSALLSQSDTQLPGQSSCPQPQLKTQHRRTALIHKSHHVRSKLEGSAVRQSYCHRSSARPKLSSTMKTPLKQPGELSHRTEDEKTSERMKGILPGNMQVVSRPLDTSAIHLDPSRATSKVGPEGSPMSHHYPRWMTSQKSEMDFSGITSVPDLKYPAWLQECDPSVEPSASTQPGHSVPSWVGELDESCQETSHDDGRKPKDLSSHQRVMCLSKAVHRNQTASLLQAQDSQVSLRELRLQFAEQLALEVENQKDTDNSQPFRDDKIESLILRAEQALNSPSLGISAQSQKQDSPGGTEDILEADRSWDNPPVTFKSPVPVGVSCTPQKSEEHGDAVREETFYSSSSGYSSRKHPGPVEALKQMLFSLQAVEHKVAQDDPAGEDTVVAEGLVPQSQKYQTPTEEVPDVVEDYKSVPGGESLQRALLHLGRLKNLVDDIKEKKEREQQAGRNLHVT